MVAVSWGVLWRSGSVVVVKCRGGSVVEKCCREVLW